MNISSFFPLPTHVASKFLGEFGSTYPYTSRPHENIQASDILVSPEPPKTTQQRPSPKTPDLLTNHSNGGEQVKVSQEIIPEELKQKQIYKKGTKKSTQLYLDFGQKSFAQNTVCNICGMLFVHGVAKDYATHATVCRDFTKGVMLHAVKSYRVVVPTIKRNNIENKSGLVIEVRSTDSSTIRKKAAAVQKIAHLELGFVPNQKEEKLKTIFLFVNANHVVGMIAVEPIQEAFLLLPHTLERSLAPVPASMGVHTIWVHANFRGQKIASQLLDAARSKFMYGISFLPSREIAFSSPTSSGILFATHYLQQDKDDELDKGLLVYDGFGQKSQF